MDVKMMRKWVSASVIYFVALAFICAIPTQAATIQLAKGTPVKVRFAPGVKITSGTMGVDAPLIFTLAEPVQIGGKTIVEAGAQGTAKVIEVKKAGKAGKPGYIKVGFMTLDPKGDYKTTDGSKIKLTGSAEGKGKGKKLLSYIFIAGLFIKGGQGEIPVDQVYTAEVAENVIMESK